MTAQMSWRNPVWMEDAACGNHPDPDIWYPDTKDLYQSGTREALRICGTCPVRDECYEYGTRQNYGGIYGGVLFAGNRPAVRQPPRTAPVERTAVHRPTGGAVEGQVPRRAAAVRAAEKAVEEPVVLEAPAPAPVDAAPAPVDVTPASVPVEVAEAVADRSRGWTVQCGVRRVLSWTDGVARFLRRR